MNELVTHGISPNERSALTHWFKGNESAVDFADMLVSATHVWDDLIDQDKPVSPTDISKAFMVGLVGLWRNVFFTTYAGELVPLIEQGINDWIDSNKFEQEKNYPAAYVLRCSIMSPIIRCASILGGHDWGREASIDIRRSVFDDYDAYLIEHGG